MPGWQKPKGKKPSASPSLHPQNYNAVPHQFQHTCISYASPTTMLTRTSVSEQEQNSGQQRSGGALEDDCTGVADARRQCESFLVRLSRCVGQNPSLTARRVTGEIEKLTPSSRQAEGAALLEHLRSRSSAAPAPCTRADPLGSTTAELWMGAQPPLVVVVSGCGCFCKCYKSPSLEIEPIPPFSKCAILLVFVAQSTSHRCKSYVGF